MSVAELPVLTDIRPAAQTSQTYRPDIDGLRAIGALGVILAHAKVPGCAGGFLGVDIFFVLSGYLITANISGRMAAGKFALLDFYARRTRRTLPALYLMVVCSLAVALLLLLPGELDQLGRSAISTVLLSSNIFFLAQTDYFDPEAMSKPLLHTWSLGVEEQFYLISPAIPFLFAKLPQPLRPWVYAGLFGLLFGFCVVLQVKAPSAAFYVMPARLWEFLAGAAVATGIVPVLRSNLLAEGLAGLGLAGLMLAMTLFAEPLPHPGFPTLLPVMATALLLHLGKTRTTFAARLLGSRVPVFLGLISYSLYLWHWPMLVFARYQNIRMTPGVWLIGGSVLVGLSYLSWKFVEEPFRAPQAWVYRRARLILASGAVLLLATCAAVLVLRGLPGRFDPAVAQVASYYDYRERTAPFREGQCFITSKNSFSAFDRTACLMIDSNRKNVLLLGDSHAAHIWTGLRDTWPAVNFLQATASGCKPLLVMAGASRCTLLMKQMLHEFLPSHRLDGVIVAALWTPEDIAPLRATLDYLKPLTDQVYIVGPLQRYDQPLPTLLAKAMLAHDFSAVAAHRVPGIAELDAQLKAATGDDARYISVNEALCPEGYCRLFAAPNEPMQFDYHHLTREGAAVLMRTIRDQHALRF